MNKKKWFVLTLAALLLLSVFAFAVVALAAENGDTVSPAADPMDDSKKKKPTATPGRGLWTPSPSPKPTPTPEPIPSFFPGLLEDHEGHSVITIAAPENWMTHIVRNYCEDCKTYFGGETVEPHAFNSEDVCFVCGYTCQHNWVHFSYKKDETFDGEEGHIEVFRCTGCYAKKQEKQPHDAGIHVAFRQDGDVGTHIEVRQCTLCKEQFELDRPHEFEHDSYRNDGDTETHFEVLVCTGCGQKADGNRTGHKPVHIGWESVSDTQDREIVRCNMCELSYTRGEPVAHTFDGVTYEPYNKLLHMKYTTCSKCGTRKNGSGKGENHYYGENSKGITCIYCQYVKTTVQHEHSIRKSKSTYSIYPLNATTHVYSYWCLDSRCAVLIPTDYTPHSFDPVTMKCECGYLKEGCAHSYSYQPVKSGRTAEKHTLIGTCTGCGKEIKVTGAHDMQVAFASAYVPNKNGHTRTVTYRCSVCGYETKKEETESHDFSSAEPISAKEHRKKCSKCGEYGSPEQHRFVCTADEAAHVCSECGKQGEHDYLLEVKDIGPAGHSLRYKCQICAHQKEKQEKHNIARTYRLSFDEERHEVYDDCTVCTYSHFMETGHHVFNENGVCIECGYKKAE